MSGLRRGQIDPGCDAVGDGSRTDTTSGLPLTRCDIRAGGMASALAIKTSAHNQSYRWRRGRCHPYIRAMKPIRAMMTIMDIDRTSGLYF